MSRVHQTDEGQQEVVDIALEVSNASKIDKLAETLLEMQRTMTLLALASKRVLTSVIVKSEDIKKEKVDSEPIVVNSSTSDEGSSTSDTRKRKASSKNGVEAAARHAPYFRGPAGNSEKWEACDDSDYTLSSHKYNI